MSSSYDVVNPARFRLSKKFAYLRVPSFWWPATICHSAVRWMPG